METSKLDKLSPFFTAIGILAGLLLVAYEIHRSTNFARAESSLEIYGDWAEVSLSEVETVALAIGLRREDLPSVEDLLDDHLSVVD